MPRAYGTLNTVALRDMASKGNKRFIVSIVLHYIEVIEINKKANEKRLARLKIVTFVTSIGIFIVFTTGVVFLFLS